MGEVISFTTKTSKNKYGAEKIQSVIEKADESVKNLQSGGEILDFEERYYNSLENDISEIKGDIKLLTKSIESSIDKTHNNILSEIKRFDDKRIDDMREIRESVQASNEHVQTMTASMHSLTHAAMYGVGTIVLTAIGILIAALSIAYSVNSTQDDIKEKLFEQSAQIQKLQDTMQRQYSSPTAP